MQHTYQRPRINEGNYKRAKDLQTRLRGTSEMYLVLGPMVGAFGEMSKHFEFLANAIIEYLTY
jgi:hypothetical protein